MIAEQLLVIIQLINGPVMNACVDVGFAKVVEQLVAVSRTSHDEQVVGVVNIQLCFKRLDAVNVFQKRIVLCGNFLSAMRELAQSMEL